MNPSINEYNQWRAKNPQEDITVDQWQKLKDIAAGKPERDIIQRSVDALSGLSKDVARAPLADGPMFPTVEQMQQGEVATAERNKAEYPSTGFAGAMDKFVGQPAEKYITGARGVTRGISEGAPKLAAELGVAAVNPAVGIPLFAADSGTSSYSAAKDAGLSTGKAATLGGVAGGIAALVPGAGAVGGKVVAKSLATAGVENTIRQKVMETAGSQIAMGGAMEGGRMIQEYGTTGKVTPITDPEIAFQTVLGQVPFVALDVPKLMGETTGTQHARLDQVKGMYDKFMSESLASYDAAAPMLGASPTVREGLNSELGRKASFASELTSKDKELFASVYSNERGAITSEAHRIIRAKFEEAAGFSDPEYSLALKDRSFVGPNPPNYIDFSGPLPPNLALRAIIKGDIKPTSPAKIPEVVSDVPPVDIGDRSGRPTGAAEEAIVDKMRADAGLPPRASTQSSSVGRGTSDETANIIRDLKYTYGDSYLGSEDKRSFQNLRDDMELVHAIRSGDATPEQTAAWAQMADPKTQTGTSVMGSPNRQTIANWAYDFLSGKRELEGFSRTDGFDENSWSAQKSVNPNDIALSINLAAHDLHERSNPKNPMEVGQLIRTVNTFSQSVDAALRKAGVEPVIIDGPDVMRITPEKLQSMYHSAYSDYLYAPNEESASRTVEWIKNQVLVQAEEATKRLAGANLPNDNLLQANWNKVLSTDKVFGPAIQTLPKSIQKFVGEQYGKFAQEGEGQHAGRWALPGWMAKVTDAISKLTPEQRQKLAEVDTQMGAAATEAGQAEKFKQSIDQRRADQRLESRNVGDTSKDLPGTQKSLSEKALKDVLSSIELTRERTITTKGKEAEKVDVPTNLYRLLTQGGLRETIYGNDAGKAGSKAMRTDAGEADLQDSISTLYDDLESDAKVNELTGVANPTQDALAGKKAPVANEGQPVETEAELQARELQQAKDLEAGNVDKTQNVDVAQVTNPVEEMTRTEALKQRLAKSFDGTVENPIQHVTKMSDLDLEVLFDKYGVGKLSKQRVRLSTALGREATMPETVEWVREFLLADPLGNVKDTSGGQVINAEFSPRQREFREKYSAAFPKAKHWQDVRYSFFNRDSLNQALLRTELLGLTPKPGVNLSEVFGKAQGQTGLPKEKFVADARQTVIQVAAEAGFQPAIAQALGDMAAKMADPFRWLTHASFAQLVDRKALVDQWDGRMFTIGAHIPSGSIVDGKLNKNPIVALLVDQGSLRWQYPRMASFLTLATWPHELFHMAVRELLEKPDANLKMNADTLAQAVALRKMLNTSAELTIQERLLTAREIAEVTMPKSAALDGPDMQAYLQHIANDPKEFAAYIYQMHSIGLAARLMETPESQGMLQWNRVAKEMSNQMVWLPDEMQIFLRSQFRTLGVFAEAMQKTVGDQQKQYGETRPKKDGEQFVTIRQKPTSGVMETIGALGKAAQEVTDAGTRASDTGYQSSVQAEALQREIDSKQQQLKDTFDSIGVAGKYRLEKQIQQAQAKLDALAPNGSNSLNEPVPEQTGVTARAMYEIIKAVAKVNAKFEQATGAIKQLASNMEAGYVPDPSTSIKQIDVSDLPNTSEMQNLPKSEKESQDMFYDSLPPEQREIFKQNWITRRLISPSFRMWDLSRRGVEEADKAFAALRGTPALTHKYISQMMTPFSIRVGNLGEIGLDKAKAYVRFLEEAKKPTGDKAHDAFNKIISEIQKQGGLTEKDQDARQDFKTGDQKAQFRMNEKAQGTTPGIPARIPWKQGDPLLQHPRIVRYAADLLKVLPIDQQHLVASALDNYFETTKQMTDMELLQAGTTSKYLIARNAMRMSKMTSSDDAILVGQLALKATEGVPVNINASIQADNQLRAMKANGIITPQTLDTVLAMGKTANEGLLKLQQNYDSMGHYAPESRGGDRIVWYTDANGEKASVGAEGKLDAIRKTQELIKAHQATNVYVELKSEMKEKKSLLSDFTGLGKVEAFISRNFDAQMALLRSQGPEGVAAADELEASPHNPKLAFGAEQMTTALNDARMHRKLYPGREHLDYVQTLEDSILHRGSAMARSDTRLQGDLTFQALENQGYKDVAKDLRVQLSEALAPTSNLIAQLNTAAASYQMGGISANLVTEATQGLTMGLPVLRMEGVPYAKTWKTFINAVHTTMGWMNKNPMYKGGKFKDLVSQYDPANLKGNSKEVTLAYHMQNFTDEGRLGVEQTVDVLKDAEVLALNQMQLGRKAQINWRDKGTLLAGAQDLGERGVAGLYVASKFYLGMFKIFTEANQRAFAYSALDVGYEKGLRGPELKLYASGLTDRLALTGGGRANRITGVTLLGANSPFLRNALSTATLLQSYGANLTWMMMNGAKDALGFTKGLNPIQRKASRDAVYHMVAASLFMAGSLGVPGIGAALAWSHKEDLARKAAKAFALLLHMDESAANIFSEVAMNGVINTTTGIDVGGRAAVSSFLGLGSNTMDLNSLAGVVPSTIKDVSKATQELGYGEFLRAMQYGGPRNMRAAAGLLKSYVDFGDARILDRQGNNVMTPSGAQQIGMVLGTSPAELRTHRQKVDPTKRVNQNFQEQNGRELDKLAILLLNKDPIKQRSVVPQVVQMAAKTNMQPKEIMGTLYDRAVDMEIPTDPTREGNIGTSQARKDINAAFGQPPPTEAARVQLKQYIAQSVGHPFDTTMPFERDKQNKKSLEKASRIDAEMQQQHLTLQEARQFVEDTTPHLR